MKKLQSSSDWALYLPGFSGTLKRLASNLSTTGRVKKQAVSITADLLVAGACLWAAYSLRHGMVFSDFRSTLHLFLLVPAITVVVFMGLGVYRWVVRSATHCLFRQLFKGSCIAALCFLVITFLFPPDRVNPRSLFVIYGLLLFAGSWSLRIVWTLLMGSDQKGEPVAIYGAGSAGQQLVSLLERNDFFRPVMFIDDDKALSKSTIMGLPVINGQYDELNTQLARREVSKVVLAMPRLSSADYHRKLQQLERTNLPILTVPSMEEIISGDARADEIRDVSINDILGRTEVAADVDLMGRRVTNKVVLVTGGGGSIGSELCRQIMRLSPQQLIILDSCEANLYHITEELGRVAAGANTVHLPEFLPLLGSVNDRKRINRIMKEQGVDTVFHAAAYKHVPIVEAQPDQGVTVNVFGTLSVLESAIQHGVADFLLISTDKAVRPTNAMGASKRVAEMILQARAHDADMATRISMVRFGNVLGSSGSVVPKFKRQILEGGPITLTHREVTRYFMTIPEAAQLVLQASAIAKGGDVFVLDMGEPVRIEELARTMVRLYGKKMQDETGNDEDIAIEVSGLRPGEKLYEELFISENSQTTEVTKITTTREAWLPMEHLEVRLKRLGVMAVNEDSAGLRTSLLELAFISENPDVQSVEENGAIALSSPAVGVVA